MTALTKIEEPSMGPPAIAQNTAVALLDVISRAAKDPNVDVEKMERLMAMHERVMAKEAEMAFSVSMQAAQKEMPQIFKDAQNSQTNSRYAKLEKVNKVVVPVYTRHGFSLSFGTADCPLPDCVRITCSVLHTMGHTKSYQCDVPMDVLGAKGNPNKTRTHGVGSSLSYGRRYLTLLIFNVSTGDDNDGNSEAGAVESVTKLKSQLWNMLKGRFHNDPNAAQQFLWDEMLMVPEKRMGDLDAAGLRAVIDKVKAKL